MVSAVFGLGGLVILVIGLVFLIIPLWAFVDAVSRPAASFTAASSSKGMWIALIVIFWFLTGIIGLILAVVYLASIRPRVQVVMP